MVNYGNLAWLHHHLGGEAESQAYLAKLDALTSKYQPPTDELHLGENEKGQRTGS